MDEPLNYRNSLPMQSMLLEYRLESILGAGGFGMTYLAWDTLLEKKVAIKEYLPVELAVRALDGSIVPINTNTEYNYKWGLDRFLQEARLLARFTHPNIVQVIRYFEANGTAYMVMNYEAGESLSQYLKRNPMPDEATLMSILLPLLDGLQAVHEAGFLHRDIKPSNIFIRENGSPLLIDFGSARLAIGGVTRTMTSVLTPGYAPLEQYSKDGNQGAWTDVYSLAGVMYRAVTGENPPDAVHRIKSDIAMAPLGAACSRYGVGFLHAINRGMEVDEKKRPQTALEWKAVLLGEVSADPARPEAGPGAAPEAQPGGGATATAEAPTQRVEKTTAPYPAPGPKQPSMSQMTWFAAGALALFLVIGGAQILQQPSTTSAPAPGQPRAPEKSLPGGAGIGQGKLTPGEFLDLDKDRNGYLTRDEIAGNPLLERDFEQIDADHDGRISLDEFVNYR